MLKRLFAFLLPRPQGLIHKGAYFWIGVLVVLPFATPDIVSDLNPMYNSDLLSGLSHHLALIMVACLYFFVQELLLQQAKFLWNDLRDIKHDATLAHSNMRYVVQGVISPEAGRIHMLVRWGLALILAWSLSPAFFVVLVVISIHQVLYEWVFKPRSDPYPMQFIVFLSVNLSLRMLGAYVALLPVDVILAEGYLLFVLGIVYLLSMGSLSFLYYDEAKTAQETANSAGETIVLPRKHSAFFLQNGKRIVSVVLPIALCMTFVLYVILPSVTRSSPLFYGNIVLFVACMSILLSRVFNVKLPVDLHTLRNGIFIALAILGLLTIVSMFSNPALEWTLSYMFIYSAFNYVFYLE